MVETYASYVYIRTLNAGSAYVTYATHVSYVSCVFSGGHNYLEKIERRQTQRQTYAERLDGNGVLSVGGKF